MVNLFDKFEIINNMKKLDFRAKKSFGQNFLIDNNICSKIASSIPEKFNDTVIEIGSGFGNLTYILAKKFKQVLSIELDNKLYSFISTEMSDFKNIKFINQDVLKININNIIFSNFQNFSNASFITLKSNSSFLQFSFLVFSNEITAESTFGAGKKQFLET